MKKTGKLRKKSKNPLPALHSKAWTLMSIWVRMKEQGVCFTCGNKKDISEMHASHFVHGNSFDFIEENIHCQCPYENTYLHGDLGKYAIKLDEKYGPGTAAKLIAIRHDIRKFTRSELESIIETLKEKIQNLSQGGVE